MCDIGETKAAIQLLRIIEVRSIKPDVVMYTTIIHHLFIDGLANEAFDLYSEMVAKGISPTIVTCTTLVYGFCILDHLQEAIEMR